MAYQLCVKAYELAQDRGRTVVGHEAANNASENESSWHDRQAARYLRRLSSWFDYVLRGTSGILSELR